jgi:diadenosine tetraphosphate (Ap4A) HIT family hydrolase
MNIELDSRLQADAYRLGEFDNSLLLLSKNALFPWFILVPDSRETEYHKLDPALQASLQQHINAIARFIEMHFNTDKINIATIGNVVSQLHIHIIGRHQHDACWPGVVWGSTLFEAYASEQLDNIKIQLAKAFEGRLRL